MKAKCRVSHEVPTPDKPGRFKKYEAGQVYDVAEINGYFEAVDEPRQNVTRATTTGTSGDKE